MSEINHVLLTALGIHGRLTPYTIGDQIVAAEFAPLALLQMLPESERPSRICALRTKGVTEKTWDSFADEVERLTNQPPIAIDIADGENKEEIGNILSKTAKAIPNNSDLTLDITHGFRHFPFLFYALALYLQSFKNVRIRDAFYGMIEGRGTSESPAPIISLRPLIELPDWFFALEMFKKTGTTSPLAELIKRIAEMIQKTSLQGGDERFRQARSWQIASEDLDTLGAAYEAGLPLEIGRSASCILRKIPEMDPSQSLVPLMSEILDNLKNSAGNYALDNKISPRRSDWKSRVLADQTEIERQFGLIEAYFERDQIPLAVGLLREWVITLILHRQGRENWLKKSVRLTIERKLGALADALKSSSTRTYLQSEQRKWAGFWSNLTNLRNELMHQGMRIEEVRLDAKEIAKIQDLRKFAKDLMQSDKTCPEFGGGLGRILISPQGASPGVLFAALKATEPDGCIIICSAQSKPSITDAISRAGFSGERLLLEMQDPFHGFDEIEDLVEKAEEFLFQADEVMVNFTGGTTMMGIAAQELLEKATKYQRPVFRFALIDKRSPEEQRSDPYRFNPQNIRWFEEPGAKSKEVLSS